MTLHDGVQDHDQQGKTQADGEVYDPPVVAILRAELGLSSGSDGFELASDAQGRCRNADVAANPQFSDDL